MNIALIILCSILGIYGMLNYVWAVKVLRAGKRGRH